MIVRRVNKTTMIVDQFPSSCPICGSILGGRVVPYRCWILETLEDEGWVIFCGEALLGFIRENRPAFLKAALDLTWDRGGIVDP
jgi:hypothetical protein